MMQVFIDMDGVIADLDHIMLTYYGLEDRKLSTEADRKHFRECLSHMVDHVGFDRFTKTERADEIAEFVSKNHHRARFSICTSRGDFHHDPSKIMFQKQKWLQENFAGTLDDLPVIFAPSGRRKSHVAHSKAILLDDTTWNIGHFREAGGIGVLYSVADHDSCMTILDELIPGE